MVHFRQLLLIIFCSVFLQPVSAGQTTGAITQHYPKRIIAIGGSITEIVYALGAEDRLVAVDSTSLYPIEALQRFPSVGYMRALSAEPVLSMAPDLILAIDDAGPPQVLDQLRGAGARVLTIPDDPSMQGVFEKIRTIAGVMGLHQQGEDLIAEIDQDYQVVSTLLSRVKTRPKVLFLLSIGQSAPLAAGMETSAHSMITLAGGYNIMSQVNGYKAITPEAIIAAAPEIVVVPQRTFDRYGSREKLFALPELATTPAAREDKLLVFDGLYLIGFGPRTVTAIRELATQFHPDLLGLNAISSSQ